ncbi:MAG: glycoside hydrolase family 5 protein, partial [Bacteroidetes bacterium]|nr:glycoside hydrolase family 5 protein [Bacteroidota bacterium]
MAQTTEMPLLHATRGIHAGLYDPDGRYVLLRGANYNALGEYWQGVPNVPATKEFEDSDFVLMEEYGFNCIRLLFTWSRLEPERGQYDTAYIARICHAVEVAAQHHIYVLLDMHQDAWGIYIASPDSEKCQREPAKGWDGAPQWATYTDGRSTCAPRSRESSPAVMRAFGNFWDDRDSIQEDCIKGWAMLVAATARYSNVLGYDLINEPNLGEHSVIREDRLIGRYYNKLIRAIRISERQAGAPQHVIL